MATTWQLPYFNTTLIGVMTKAAGGQDHATLGMTVTINSDDPAKIAAVELAAAHQGVVLRRLQHAGQDPKGDQQQHQGDQGQDHSP